MLTTDIYGKTLSNYFNSGITAYSQFVKPKITIDLLDSRHVENLTITNTDEHTVSTKGSIGYYFNNSQLMNGYDRETFTWAVTDAKEKDGTVIKADGRWYATPSSLNDDYEFGWWSKTKSQANGVFASSPTLTMDFDVRKINKVRVTTSETLGQVRSFRIRVQTSGSVDLVDKTIVLADDEFYKDIYLKSNNAINANFEASRVILTVISTKNGLDCGRIHEVSPIYEVDITDYVIDYTVSRTRDVHESSLPIGGTQSPSINISLDNTSKDWGIFNNASQYGKYMRKDLKINISTGWRIKKTDDVISTTALRSAISNSDSFIDVFDSSIFPIGGASNYFTATIDPDNESREILLFGENTPTAWTGASHASTSKLGTARTNLIINPSFETNTTGWSVQNGATAAISSLYQTTGSSSALVTSSATDYNGLVLPTRISVTPNTNYYLSAYCRNISGSTRNVYIGIQWYNSAGTYLSELNSGGQGTLTTAAGWVRRSASGVSPSTAASAQIFMLSGQTGLTAGWQTAFDGVLFETGSTLLPYFDGSTIGEITPTAWTGTSHASTSQLDASTSQLGVSRTNLITNPSFETNTTGWAGSNTTLAISSSFAYAGSSSLRGTIASTGTNRYIDKSIVTVTGSTAYSYSCWVYLPATNTANTTWKLQVYEWNGTAYTVANNLQTTTVTRGVWTRFSGSFTTAAATIAVQPRLINEASIATGQVVYIDAALLETGSTVLPYFDGSTIGENPVDKNIADENTLKIAERGYYNSDPIAHTANAVVQFDPYEYVNMGTYYVDEWSSSTSDMTVSIKASDFSKFLSEKNLTDGFLIENKTVGDAVLNLLMRANFPRNNFRQIVSYSGDQVNFGAVARYSFSEDAIDKTGALVSLENGLRARFWGMRTDSENEYKMIKADVLEKNLSIEKRIEGIETYPSPDLTELSTISGAALNYSNYSFTSILTSETFTNYFNGVVDGYYIPLYNGNQDLILRIANGGGRIYLDDVLILETGTDATSSTDVSAYTFRGNAALNLTAGVPYRLRIEFWHGYGASANFSIALYKNNLVDSNALVNASEVKTTTARDALGSRNSSESLGSYSRSNIELSHHQNDGVLSSNVQLSYTEGIIANENNRGILLIDNAYVRIPNHTSIAIGEKDFTVEAVVQFYDGFFSGTGEYLSTWSNSSPTNGYEFYFNGATSHGVKIKTTIATYTASSSTELDNDVFYHIVASYSAASKTLSYYLNGVLQSQTVVSGNVVTQASDITIGGRGASFTANTGESGIVTGRTFILDEFALYKKCLLGEDVFNRFKSTQVKTPTVFPFLYSGIGHIREAIDSITLSDLGRFYIDEEGYARYESYNNFFEPSIDQHANVQYTISDSSNIISSNFTAQLQTNKVIVKVSSVTTSTAELQGLWTAPSPTTLAVVTLAGGILANATLIPVSTTIDPVFANTGYLALSKTVSGEVLTEIIKYTSKTEDMFLSVERGKFDTVALDFDTGTKVREARYYEVNYDKTPATSIKQPLATGIYDEEPDNINILKFDSSAYSAKLIIAASDSNDDGQIIYVQGKDPVTEKETFVSIAGVPIVVIENNEQVTEQVESLQDNIRKYGLKELTIDSPYINSIEHATEIAKFIIEKMSEPVPIINVEIMAIPTLQLGDRIKIGSLDSFDIIDGEYWVISQEFSYGDSISHSLVLRKVV
jgi:hypothetical protein